ncbi:hypothetical protein V5O48_015218 [Marasmius crinis-equi]|uniref:ABM domain-containing protein n=1 Tax=Marasmius crinis-equi TaxID=585013 RepID=A0ABR3EV36_9AGAR
MSTTLPTNYEGKLFLLVQITAATGKEEELARLLRGMETSSITEVDTLSYHMGRGFGAESNKFTVYESFANSQALETHRESEASSTLFSKFLIADLRIHLQAFKALKSSGTMGDLKLTYYLDF